MDPVRNFLRINDNLSCAGQPAADQLEGLKTKGFEIVINLGLLNTDYSLDDEQGLAESCGLKYYHIPVDFTNPTIQDLNVFTEIMDSNSGKKIFVHCAANKRASVFAGLYLYSRNVADREQCISIIESVWEPNQVWQEFIDECLEQS
jgi:protein tyrosine phosphatase (PTP) superfamily phosphohydrolase (DUF442 family)